MGKAGWCYAIHRKTVPHTKPSRQEKKGSLSFSSGFGVFGVLAVICAAVSEKGLSSISEELTKETARNYLVSTVNRAVNNQLESGKSSFVEVSRSGSGQVSAVSADSEAINRLKGNILTELTKELNGKCSVSVPIGSLSEVGLFNGRGFPVPIRLNFEGSADITFSYGISLRWSEPDLSPHYHGCACQCVFSVKAV